MQQEYGDRVAFVGVSSRDDTGAMADFVADYGVGAFPHAADVDAVIWAAYGVTTQPAFAFIDDDGAVDVHVGVLGEDGLRGRVQALLAT